MKLRTFGLALFGVAGLVSLSACKKDEAAPAPSTPTATEQAKPTAAAPAQTPPAPVGHSTIHGVVKFTGAAPAGADIAPPSDPACEGMALKDQPVMAKDGKLQNVLVRVKGPVAGAPAASQSSPPVVVDQLKCTYTPRVMGAQAGQPIQVRNSDQTLHNVRAMAGGKPLFNMAQPPSMPPVSKATPPDVEMIQLKCDVHPWMKAFVVVSQHPYFSTTGDDGAFSISGLPAGTYTLEAWHETLGTKTAQVTVKDGETAEASFEFNGSDKG
ncbi:MAG: carboxypeptidase regulatory-like domain-containing protein [Hyalangium sp.]|uniref:carboxypeptidase regulatory-like domain-containing protein n=1 Tax=Hyalangium sp. TaxID=2028555 RepID=UPI00389A67F4